MLIEVRLWLFSRTLYVEFSDLSPFRRTHAKKPRAASFAAAEPDTVDAPSARCRAAMAEYAAQDQGMYCPAFLCLPSEKQSSGNPQRLQCPIRAILARVE